MSGIPNWLENSFDDIRYTFRYGSLLDKLTTSLVFLFLIGLTILILFTTLPALPSLLINIGSYISSNIGQIVSAFIVFLLLLLLIKLDRIKYYSIDNTEQLMKSVDDLSVVYNRNHSRLMDELMRQNSFMVRLNKSNDDNLINLINQLNDIKSGLTDALKSQNVGIKDSSSAFNSSDQVGPQTIFSIYTNIASEYSHTIKTPLSSIESTNEKIKIIIMELLSELPEKEQKNLSILLESIENSSISIEYMYNILNEGAGFIPREPKKFSIQSMVRKAIRIVRESTKNDVEVLINLEDVPEVEQYWLNLFIALVQVIENAFEAVAKDGQIIISSKYYSDEKKIEILITNDGTKIPDEFREKMFNKKVSTKGDSRGSGLFITKRVLEKVNGEVRLVESNDQKTTFGIKFNLKSIVESEPESIIEPEPESTVGSEPECTAESEPKSVVKYSPSIIDFIS